MALHTRSMTAWSTLDAHLSRRWAICALSCDCVSINSAMRSGASYKLPPAAPRLALAGAGRAAAAAGSAVLPPTLLAASSRPCLDSLWDSRLGSLWDLSGYFLRPLTPDRGRAGSIPHTPKNWTVQSS